MTRTALTGLSLNRFALFAHALFDSAPLMFLEGAIILGIGGLVMAVLEIEKALCAGLAFWTILRHRWRGLILSRLLLSRRL